LTVIAFTRPERRLSESILIARNAGFTVMTAPSLEIIPCSTSDKERLLRSIRQGDIVVFTSATSVEECGKCPFFKASVTRAKIVSIGPGTTETLSRWGVTADSMPSEYSSEGIVAHLRDSVAGKRVILIRSDRGSPVLDQGLRAAGADVTDFAAYSLKTANPKRLDGMLDAGVLGKIDVFAFTSPLSARAFVMAAEHRAISAAEMLGRVKVAAIGKPTANALASLGIGVDIMPENSTFEEMIAAIKKAIF